MGVSLRVFFKNWGRNGPRRAVSGQKNWVLYGDQSTRFFLVFFEYDIDDEIAGLFFVI